MSRPAARASARSRPPSSTTATSQEPPCCSTPAGAAHFGTPEYAHGAPFLGAAGVAELIRQGVALVGIDSLNIDDTESGGERPAHSGLLAAGIHVVEHLTNLDALPVTGARFTAAPPAVEGFGTFPVRAFALLPVARAPTPCDKVAPCHIPCNHWSPATRESLNAEPLRPVR